MTAYRHKNGGGLKVFPAQASPDSFLDRLSTVEGETNVYGGSAVEDSALKDTFAAAATLLKATVCDSRIVDSFVDNADLVSCEVVEAQVVDSRLTGCKVFANDGARPRLRGVGLDGVTVYGDVALVGPWTLELPGAHIHDGEWNVAPRHLLVEGDGIHVAVLECTEGRAHIGCECRPVKQWLEGRRCKRASRYGWTGEQIEACRNFLKSLSA